MDLRDIPPARILLNEVDKTYRWATGRSRPRIVFQHLPKCAGSSVTYFLRRRIGTAKSGQFYEFHEFDSSLTAEERNHKALNAKFAAGHFGMDLLETIRPGAIVFTFLREPRKRLQSAYRFIRSITESTGETYCSYEEFLSSDNISHIHMRDNIMTRLMGASYFTDLSAPDERTMCLQRAKSQLVTVDFFGFQEDFDDDFPALMRLLDFSVPRKAPKERVTKITDHSEVRGWTESRHIQNLEDACIELDVQFYEFARNLKRERSSPS
ncbi:MAG: sulfotransferase family 2 domain-containing protein [Pseudomonadota bacterium]